MSLPTRRMALQHSLTVAGMLVSCGLWSAPALAFNARAFGARTLQEALRAYGAQAPVESREVILGAPDIAEDGSAVAITMSSSRTDVRQLMLFVERNPQPLAALFHLSDSVDASVGSRVKMAESSPVFAVAILSDGRALFARKEVRVTLGGCAA